MNRDQLRAARATCVALMQAGHSATQALAASSLPRRRSAAYALFYRFQTDGDVALDDRRCGHPHKLTPPLHDALVALCLADPHLPSHRLQALLAADHGVTISISRLNGVRAALDLRYVRPKKTER
jgi:transposase